MARGARLVLVAVVAALTLAIASSLNLDLAGAKADQAAFPARAGAIDGSIEPLSSAAGGYGEARNDSWITGSTLSPACIEGAGRVGLPSDEARRVATSEIRLAVPLVPLMGE